MAALLLRLLFLTGGLGVTEIALTGLFGRAGLGDWLLLLVVGFPLLVAGTAGILSPAWGSQAHEGTER